MKKRPEFSIAGMCIMNDYDHIHHSLTKYVMTKLRDIESARDCVSQCLSECIFLWEFAIDRIKNRQVEKILNNIIRQCRIEELKRRTAEAGFSENRAASPEHDLQQRIFDYREILALYLEYLEPDVKEIILMNLIHGLSLEELAVRFHRPVRVIIEKRSFGINWLKKMIHSPNKEDLLYLKSRQKSRI